MKSRTVLVIVKAAFVLSACVSNSNQTVTQNAAPIAQEPSLSEIMASQANQSQVQVIEGFGRAFDLITCSNLALDLGDASRYEDFLARGRRDMSGFYQTVRDGEIDEFHYKWHAPLLAISYNNVVDSETSTDQLAEETNIRIGDFLQKANEGDRDKTRSSYQKLCPPYE